jgi:signal transduction histidine kinase
VRLSARLLVEDGRRWVRFSVADRGRGVPPGTAARILDPFFTTKARPQHSGLGLAVAFGIANMHGGRLQLDPAPTAGACFHLDLPAPMDPPRDAPA